VLSVGFCGVENFRCCRKLLKIWCARRDSNSRPFGSKGISTPYAEHRPPTKYNQTLKTLAAPSAHFGCRWQQFTDRKRTAILLLTSYYGDAAPWVYNLTCRRNSKRHCALRASVRRLSATHTAGNDSVLHRVCPCPCAIARLPVFPEVVKALESTTVRAVLSCAALILLDQVMYIECAGFSPIIWGHERPKHTIPRLGWRAGQGASFM